MTFCSTPFDVVHFERTMDEAINEEQVSSVFAYIENTMICGYDSEAQS